MSSATSNRKRERHNAELVSPDSAISVNDASFCDDVIFVGTTGPQRIEVVDLSTPVRTDTTDTSRKRIKKSGDKSPLLMCAVCMESILANNPTSTKCGHVFCNSCITQVVAMSRKCPLCNKSVNPNQLIRLYLG